MNGDLKPWRGYTLDELRFQRVLAATRIAMEKRRLTETTQSLTTKHRVATSLFGRLLGALSYVDYATIAFAIGRRLFKIFKRSR